MRARRVWSWIGRLADFITLLGWKLAITIAALTILWLLSPVALKQRVATYFEPRRGLVRWCILPILILVSFSFAAITVRNNWIKTQHWPETRHVAPLPSLHLDRAATIEKTRSEDDSGEGAPSTYPKDRRVTNNGSSDVEITIGESARRQSAYKISQRLGAAELGFQVELADGSTTTLGLEMQVANHHLSSQLIVRNKAGMLLIDPTTPKDNAGKWSTGAVDVSRATRAHAHIYVDSHLQFREDFVFAHLEYSMNSKRDRISLGSAWVRFPLPAGLKPLRVRPVITLKPGESITIFEAYYGDPLGVEQ